MTGIMWSNLEKLVLQHLFGAKLANVGAGVGEVIQVVAEVEADVTAIKNLQPGQTVTLPEIREKLFGEVRTITVVVGNPTS